MPSTRSVLVGGDRLPGWLTRFEQRNGSVTMTVDDARGDGSVRLVAANGCTAVLMPPLRRADPARSAEGASPADPAADPPARTCRTSTEDLPPVTLVDTVTHTVLDRLLNTVPPSVTVGLLLVRRGGYSVGVARDGVVVSSKTGTRYVQGKTAAGGWSQQRFARRRANQADALVEETAARAAALFTADRPSVLQLGGDRTLAATALAEPVLKAFAELPQVPFQTVPDPRFVILREVARSALAVRIIVTDPPG